MNRSISLILFMAFSMLSGLAVSSANADPSIHQTGGHILIADNATETPAAGETGLPNVMIPEPLFTFDTVVDGTEVVHDFRVYNRGTGELAIEKVQTG